MQPSILAGVYLDCFQVSRLQHPHMRFGVHTGESFLGKYLGLGLLGHGHGHRQRCLWQIVLQNGRTSLFVHFPLCPSQGSLGRLCHHDCFDCAE